MYRAYYHIDVLGKDGVDVVDALCENNGKFAIQRKLPRIEIGDLLVIDVRWSFTSSRTSVA